MAALPPVADLFLKDEKVSNFAELRQHVNWWFNPIGIAENVLKAADG